MANMIVANNRKELTPVIVFDSAFKKALMKCQPDSVVDLDLERMRDGGITLRNVL